MSNIHTIRYDRYCIVCFLVWTWVWRYFSEIIVDIGMNRLPRRTQLSQKCWFLEWLIKGHMCIIIAKLSYDYWQFPIHWFDVRMINISKTIYCLFTLPLCFFIILLILIIFSIVFYWYVSSKEYWYAQMSIDMLKWALPRFHGLAVIKY